MINTINSVSVEDFIAMSGVTMVAERTSAPPQLEAHEARKWHHFSLCIWVEGRSGEAHLKYSYLLDKPWNEADAIAEMIRDLRIVESCTTAEEYIETYGSGYKLYPELAEQGLRRAKQNNRHLQRVLGEWYEFALNHVDTD